MFPRIWLVLSLVFLFIPVRAQDEALPPAADLIEEGGDDLLHLLLIGSATEDGNRNPGLTDTLMVVSVNRTNGSVGVISIPRDYYAYVPEFGMYKINQAYFLAEMRGADGIATLRETILYNFGLQIDYYARVDFTDFGNLIDTFGGVDLAVDCAIQDWKLIAPDLDKQDPDNWEMFTLWTGLQHLDGETALWYVRSRRTSSDFDRSRRQQDVLRALWRRIRSSGLVSNAPLLWEQFQSMVETDLTLVDMLTLLPVAANLDPAQVRYYTFRLNHEVTASYAGEEGRFVLIPDREAVAELMREALLPNTRRLNQQAPTVAIYNGSGVPGMDYVAAQRLEREGFRTVITGEYARPRDYNLVVDYTGGSKDNPVSIIQDVLRITDEGVQIDPDPARSYDYAVYIGYNYQYFSCTFAVQQPEYTPEPDDAP